MKWKYILKRILIAIPTFFGITILAYFILNMAPGSPLDALLADPGITPAELERKRVALGLDQPVIIQYFTWLKQLPGNSRLYVQLLHNRRRRDKQFPHRFHSLHLLHRNRQKEFRFQSSDEWLQDWKAPGREAFCHGKPAALWQIQ